jgi:hypothetical protein
MRIDLRCFGLCFWIIVVFTGCYKQITPVSLQPNSSEETGTSVDDNDNSIQNTNFNFDPLKTDEALKCKIEDNNINVHLRIYVVSGDGEQELFTIPIAYSRNYKNDIQFNQSQRRMVFQCKPYSPELFELWFVDGEDGTIKTLFAESSSYSFKIDDMGELLCFYNGIESSQSRVPILHIYEIAAMRDKKKVIYEPYRNKDMYPVEMSFKDNAFTVKLSADTVDFATLEIPADESEEYRVIESYSWQEENER